jgi:hypothetical protein
MEDTGTEVLELTASGLCFGREQVMHDDLTLLVETDRDNPKKYKVAIRVGGNLGKRLSAGRKVRARRKN